MSETQGFHAWPFTASDLTAGLRLTIGDRGLQVTSVDPLPISHLPCMGRIRAMKVSYQTEARERDIRLVVKEPRAITRTGLAGAGRREVGVYRWLASELPLKTPVLLAASPVGEWLLMEEVRSKRAPLDWTETDYLGAVEALVVLHSRFWGMGEDLSTFAWLSRPWESDFEVHVSAAANAIERMVKQGEPEGITTLPERMQVLAALTTYADQVAAPLRAQPFTLLHGDYWPGNLALQDDGIAVYDWQLTGVGPGIMDMIVLMKKSEWWFDDPPFDPERLLVRYAEGIQKATGTVWTKAELEELVDHAIMWRFMQEWVDLLAASPEPVLRISSAQLDKVWLNPIRDAIRRRLKT